MTLIPSSLATVITLPSHRGRSGQSEIWIGDVNGSGTRQLTHGTGESQGSPHWSPDGRTIAFDAVTSSERHWHIWTIDTDGGAPRQLTQAVGNQTVPTWSHDGRWIYYSADLPGRAERNIWRVPAGGGTPEQITRDGSGYLAIELADGKELMYQASSRDSALFRLPLQGGRRINSSIVRNPPRMTPARRKSSMWRAIAVLNHLCTPNIR
jgi:Tol biopolymer transport system component